MSFNKEQAIGNPRHNVITIVMYQFDMDYDNAVTWVANYHDQVKAKFLDGLNRLPSFGSEADHQLSTYLHEIAHWARANASWNFECGRYFGSRAGEYDRTRMVPLFPASSDPRTSLHGENVIIPFIDRMNAVSRQVCSCTHNSPMVR